ncbi:hypothetical protein WDW89_18595 [Deltaproteobacteria bacterium TL4]
MSLPNSILWLPWYIGATSFILTLVMTPVVIRIAQVVGWVAQPKSDRWHKKPTALMGGVAIYMGSTVALGGIVDREIPWISSSGGATFLEIPWMIWGGATFMFFVGLIDDVINIKPAGKFVAQVIGTSILLFSGYAFGGEWPAWVNIPLTFIWVIGITNALNLLDNMDGLAAGIAAISTFVMAIFSVLSRDIVTAGLLASITGAACGFLVYNFNPAKIFMGDCGSLFLGYVIAALAIGSHSKIAAPGGTLAVLLVPVAVMAVPIFDTTLVTLVRFISGRPISQGGRDHTSHRLVFLGFSEKKAVLTLYGVSLLFGSLGVLFSFMEIRLFYSIVIYMGLGMAAFGVFLGSLDVYEGKPQAKEESEDGLKKQRHVAIQTMFHQRQFIGAMADSFLIYAAFVLAHYLRFEEGISPLQQQNLYQLLPLVIGVKLPVLYLFGLYRGVWRYTGASELIKIIVASAVGSLLLLSSTSLFFPAIVVSRSVFIIDLLLTAMSLATIRFSFPILRQYFSLKPHHGKRALLYGAGDAGMLSLNAIRKNASLGFTPVGFIDDDASLKNLTVQGFPILGTLANLQEVCQKHDIEEVLLTTFSLSPEQKSHVSAQCKQLGLSYREFQINFT